jgi:threonine aldolase
MNSHTHGPVIDLRSDTVTRPTPAMRQAMANAEVGDDVLGDDPTVIALQDRIAEIMGKEAACFVPSGTMANQCAIRAHTEPGDEVIAHKDSHIIHYETGAPAALSGVMVRPLDGEAGLFDSEDVEHALRPDNCHSPRSRLLIVENTHNRGGGSVWPLEQIQRVTAIARKSGLRTHLDGARVWNACAATGVTPVEYAGSFDTLSCCFSKGLGAPVGSAVCGDKATISRVHRFRKMFGGAMRQSGVLAAAARHALEHHRERLSEDHANARLLGELLREIPGVVIPLAVETNMVFFDLAPKLGSGADFCAKLKSRDVWMLPTAPQRVRAVCHLDVDRGMIQRAAEVIRELAGASVPVAAR